MISANYNGAEICVKTAYGGNASLVINGNVYAKAKLGTKPVKMSAVVGGVEYVYERRSPFFTGGYVALFANGIIIAHK
jgi:hypothetical protein